VLMPNSITMSREEAPARRRSVIASRTFSQTTPELERIPCASFLSMRNISTSFTNADLGILNVLEKSALLRLRVALSKSPLLRLMESALCHGFRISSPASDSTSTMTTAAARRCWPMMPTRADTGGIACRCHVGRVDGDELPTPHSGQH
jgi:hypothetical protein